MLMGTTFNSKEQIESGVLAAGQPRNLRVLEHLTKPFPRTHSRKQRSHVFVREKGGVHPTAWKTRPLSFVNLCSKETKGKGPFAKSVGSSPPPGHIQTAGLHLPFILVAHNKDPPREKHLRWCLSKHSLTPQLGRSGVSLSNLRLRAA